MATRWTLIAAVIAATTPAYARTITTPYPSEPIAPARIATIAVDSGATVASSDLVVHDVGDTAVATLTLTLTSRYVTAASTTLALPADARVVGMALAHGTDAFVARPLDRREADQRFAAAVDPPPDIVVPRAPTKRDPAILQLEGDGAVRLTVFPISPDAPATVTIQLAMPRADRTRLVIGGHVMREAVDRDPATAEDIELADRPTALDPDRALYAAPLAAAPSVDELASTLRGVMPTLARCAAVDDREGTQYVSLQVHVDALGHASLDQAGGANGSLTDCLHQVVEHIQLGDDAPTTLRYDFVVAPARVKAL